MKMLSKSIWLCGTLTVLFLGMICLFGSREPIFPEAMIAYSWREASFMGLAFGSVPMLAACAFFYKCRGIRSKDDFVLIFLPGFICTACVLYIAVIIAVLILAWL